MHVLNNKLHLRCDVLLGLERRVRALQHHLWSRMHELQHIGVQRVFWEVLSGLGEMSHKFCPRRQLRVHIYHSGAVQVLSGDVLL